MINTVLTSDKQTAVLAISFHSQATIIFNGVGEPANFKNPSLKDSIISKTFVIDKPTHLFFGNIKVISATERVVENGSLIILPGDSILLTNNGASVAFSTIFQNYIDNIIRIPLICYNPNVPELNKNLKTIGLKAMIERAKQNYKRNQNNIDTSSLNQRLRAVLNCFNYMLLADEITWIPFEKLNQSDKMLMDSAYKDILINVDKIESVQSNLHYVIYDKLLRYNAFTRGYPLHDSWNYFDKVDTSISNSSFYQPYLISTLKATYHNLPDEFPHVVSELNRISHPSKVIDTLKELANILTKTKADYAAAKQELNQYTGGRYASLLEEDVSHHQRSIQTLSPVTLFDFNDKRTTLQNVMFDSNTDITVLDFWASWCVPCVGDYPYLKKIETALKGKRVKFLSISIDKEEDKDEWINRTKQLKTFNQPNQFRLQDPEHSAVRSYFNLSSIPRYIVIDKNRKILSEEFDRLNEAGFQRKLTAWLSQY